MECRNCDECDPSQFRVKKNTNKDRQEEDKQLYAQYLKDGNVEKILQLKEPLCNKCRKIRNLSEYKNWSSVEEMWVEFKKVEPRCRFHHNIKTEHSRILKDVVVNEYHRRCCQVNKQYNIQLKQERGECWKCKRPFTIHEQAGFDWCHRDRKEKDPTIKRISDYFKLCPATAQPKLKSETSICDLGCRNCHKIDTDDGI